MKLLPFLVVGLIVFTKANSQDGLFYYPFQKYTIREGLPQMQVERIFQDSRGYLWLGTRGGVSKFNGKSFQNFDLTEGLAHSYINDIQEDKEGNVWIANSYGLAKYNGADMECFPKKPSIATGIAFDENGTIWIGQEKGGLFYFDGEKIHESTHPEFKGAGHTHVHHVEGEGFLLIATEKAIYSLKEGVVEKLLEMDGESVDGFDKQHTGRFFIKARIKTRHYRWYIYEKGHFKPVLEIEDKRLVFNQLEENFHLKWDRTEIAKISPGSYVPTVYPFPISMINLPFLDRDNNLWIGAEEGLLQFFGETFQIASKEQLPGIWTVLEDEQNNYWFGAYAHGLKKYDGEKLTQIELPKPLHPKTNFYMGASKDNQGNLYFPVGNGTLKYDGELFEKIDNKTALFSYYDEENSSLLVGVDEGINIIKDNDNIQYWGIGQGLHDNSYIVAIAKDNEGGYWLGSSRGLSRLSLKDSTVVNYTKKNGRLPVRSVISITKDHKENLWFGSKEGLLRYDAQTDSILRIAQAEIPYSVYQIGAVDSSYLIVSQLEGFFLMDLQKWYRDGQVSLKFFNYSNGFLGIEPNQNGLTIDSKGHVWMTTNTELVKLDPQKVNFGTTPVEIHFNSVNGIPLTYKTDRFELPKNEKTAIVGFEAVGFERPDRVQYAYRLGSEGEWSDWQEREYAILTNLSSGEHELQVKTNVPGLPVAEPIIASIPLVVDLSFWNQPWFIPSVFALLILGILTALLLMRREQVRAHENEQRSRLLQVQTLQAQMNPHFVFNVLGSLQNLILRSNIERANRYLVNLSKLIRSYLKASIKSDYSKGYSSENEITLQEEIDLLKMYLEFEKLQFKDKFDYKIVYDEKNIVPENRTIPPMLLQPYVENAVKHGLLHKTKGKGELTIQFIENGDSDSMTVIIKDNGVGMDRARIMRQNSPRSFKSQGRALTEKRIGVLREMGYYIDEETISTDEGTTVTLHIG